MLDNLPLQSTATAVMNWLKSVLRIN